MKKLIIILGIIGIIFYGHFLYNKKNIKKEKIIETNEKKINPDLEYINDLKPLIKELNRIKSLLKIKTNYIDYKKAIENLGTEIENTKNTSAPANIKEIINYAEKSLSLHIEAEEYWAGILTLSTTALITTEGKLIHLDEERDKYFLLALTEGEKALNLYDQLKNKN